MSNEGPSGSPHRPDRGSPPRRSDRGLPRRRASSSLEDLGEVERRPRTARRAGLRNSSGTSVLAALILLTLVGATAFAIFLHGRSDLSAARPPAPAAYAFVFVVDGMAAADVSSITTPNIAHLAKQGISYPSAWVGQAESSSLASNASIGTGLFPSNDGVVGWQWSSPHSAQVVAPASPTQVQLGSLDQVMQSHSRDSLSSRVKSRYPNDHVVSISGSQCGVADAAGTWTADYVLCPRRQSKEWLPGSVTGHAPPLALLNSPGLAVPVLRGRALGAVTERWQVGTQDDWVARCALAVLAREKPRLTILNFPEIEQVLRFAPSRNDGDIRRGLLRGVDRDIGRVVAATRVNGTFDRSVFVITSDQALASVAQRLQKSRIADAILGAGGEQTYLASDMSAAAGVRDPLQVAPVAAALRSVDRGNIDIVFRKVRTHGREGYRAEALRSLSNGFIAAESDVVGTMASVTSPDIVLVYSPGVSTFGVHASRLPEQNGGMGMQWPNLHIPFILAGHGIVQGATSRYPARLVDLAPTLTALMHLATGSPDGLVLADALYQPPAGSVMRQENESRHSSPLVRALQERSGH